MATSLLVGCGAGDSLSGTNSGGDDGGGGGSSNLLLQSVQSPLSGVLTQLGTGIQASTPNNVPLDVGGFVLALDPITRDLLFDVDSLLSAALSGLQALATNPSQAGFITAADHISTGLMALPGSITQLSQQLPCALGTLLGQRAAVCQGDSAAGQLQNVIQLFDGSNNPLAGTPLAPLGAPGGPGGSTGTPLDTLITPLLAILGDGTPGSATPLSGELVDQLGQGLAWVGDAIVDGYNNLPGNSQIPVAGQLIFTLGNTIADLGLVLTSLETDTAQTIGNTLIAALQNVNNLLTAPGGLLGSLASAGNQPALISGVAAGNAQLGTVITMLGQTLDVLLTAGDQQLLEPLLEALAPLTCALSLFGDCNGDTDGLNTLIGGLESLLDTDLLNDLGDLLGLSSNDTGNLLDNLAATIDDLPLLGGLLGGGSTGLLGLGFLGL